MNGPTLKELPIYHRMLLHLVKHERRITPDNAPYAMSIDGIADAIGRNRAQISISAVQCEEQGWVRRETLRVVGLPTRRKVIILTEQGRIEAARAARIVDSLGYTIEQVIRAPPIGTIGDRLNEISRRLTSIETEAQDLRRELDGIRGASA